MKVKTPSFTIPSFSFRVELLVFLLVLVIATSCFTFQSCCKVGWYEGMTTIKQELKELKGEENEEDEEENKQEGYEGVSQSKCGQPSYFSPQ